MSFLCHRASSWGVWFTRLPKKAVFYPNPVFCFFDILFYIQIPFYAFSIESFPSKTPFLPKRIQSVHLPDAFGPPLKYYFEDVGLRNARLGFRQVEETHLMENVIYNELRIRGYQVDIGVVVKRDRNKEGLQEKKQLEIDFVANMGSKRYYIQSAFSLPDEENMAKEKASLVNVNDSFRKIIIVKDVIKPWYDNDGILTMGIYDFLLNDTSLDF